MGIPFPSLDKTERAAYERVPVAVLLMAAIKVLGRTTEYRDKNRVQMFDVIRAEATKENPNA